jgi:sulfide:quinone oxidoreductase
VVSQGDTFHFVPSNPWVAVHWRKRDAIEVDLPPVFRKRGIGFSGWAPSGKSCQRREPDRTQRRHDGRLRLSGHRHRTGSGLRRDPGLGPHGGFTQSICHVDHAEAAAEAFDVLVENPGPIIVGAVQGASCFGPAYEFAMILDTELERRRIRDKVPMTFVTSEPYVGHLGLDGVGDTKGLLESEMRERHIKWVTNARVASVEAGLMHVEEINEDGAVKARTHDIPFAYSMMLPAFRGVAAVRGMEG